MNWSHYRTPRTLGRGDFIYEERTGLGLKVVFVLSAALFANELLRWWFA